MYFDIKRYAIHDGPGIRVTVFFKGCPLSCIWCHNPEGISPRRELMYTGKRCIGCGACVLLCPHEALSREEEGGKIAIDRGKCRICGTCAGACPANALEISGKPVVADEIMKEIEKETLVIDQSGGGVTFSGGEPLMHHEVLLELLIRCGELSIHRTVDTSLYADPDVVRKVMEHTDLFLVDLKHIDPEKHQACCGVPNGRILDNYRLLAGAGKAYIVRIPLIAGVNTEAADMAGMAGFIRSLPGKKPKINLLPYHDIGRGKYEKLGKDYRLPDSGLLTPTDALLKRSIEIFHSYGLEAETGA